MKTNQPMSSTWLLAVMMILGSNCDFQRFLPEFTLHVETEGSGSVDPSEGTFKLGEQVSLTATPSGDARFDHWEGDASGSENPLVITIDSDKNITAVFTEEGTIASGPFSVLLLGIQAVVLNDGTLSVAVPLKNASESAAANVQITGIEIPDSQFLGPGALPIDLGEMSPETTRTVNSLFSPVPSQPDFLLTIRGTFDDGSSSSTFELTGEVDVQPANSGPIQATGVAAPKLTAANAVFPPTPPPPPEDFEFNEGNQQDIRPPLGPFRDLFAAASPASALDVAQAFNPKSQRQLQVAPTAVVFTRNTTLTAGGGLPPDPTIAGPDPSGFVMYAVNSRVGYSTNFGTTFTDVALTAGAGFTDPGNPARTDFFPQNDGGLCCDQVIIYIPAPRNIFVWLLQYNAAPIVLGGVNTTGPNRLRLAYATPQAAAADFLHAWSWIDITSATVNIGNDWMDYPDLSYSDTFLYVGVDHAIQGTSTARSNRHIFVRVSLNDMLNPNAANVGLQFTNPTRGLLFQNHIVQSSNDAFYWAALPDTSTLVVYDWPDNSNTVNSHDIAVSTWCNTNYPVNAPDNLNWNVAPALALGATRTNPAPPLCPPGQSCPPVPRFLYFAWSAGSANPCTVGNPPKTITGRPFPYVRVAKVNAVDFTLVSEADIWSPSFAFATPALVSHPQPPGSSLDEVAISLAVGGGGGYANNAVGFLGDGVFYVTTDSDATQAAFTFGGMPPVVTGTAVRYGDYFNVRNSFAPVTANGQGEGFSTLGYAVRRVNPAQPCTTGGCNVVPHFVQFGRQRDLFPSPPVVVK